MNFECEKCGIELKNNKYRTCFECSDFEQCPTCDNYKHVKYPSCFKCSDYDKCPKCKKSKKSQYPLCYTCLMTKKKKCQLLET